MLFIEALIHDNPLYYSQLDWESRKSNFIEHINYKKSPFRVYFSHMTRTRRETSCGVIPFRKLGDEYQFLLLHQNNGDWSFPKGHTEEGESYEETAMREFSEESGASLKKLYTDTHFSFHFQKEYPYYLLEKEVILFLGELADGDISIQEEEIQDFCLCPAEEVLRKLPFESTRSVFREALVFLEKMKEKGIQEV